jgi:hypothetical protein
VRVQHLQDADQLLLPAVREAIAALKLTEEDAGTVKLAEQYARAIDGAGRHCGGCDDADCKRESNTWAMRWLAPLLLDALTALGATPTARAKLKGGKPEDAAEDPIDALRRARSRRTRA